MSTSPASMPAGPAATPSTPSPAGAAVAGGLPKTYNPADAEPRVIAAWDRAGAFHPDPARILEGGSKPYCIFIPPPNVTAALHLGHALNNTLQDVLIRAHRMMGFETLWMPGTDHAGIATQAVVEKRVLKEEGKRRQQFSREDFVAKIQAFKDEYEATITAQLKAMGCSCDWDRQRFTMDDQCAAAVREAFFRLFKDGLIYRGKRLVNWDPALQTAVADDECYDEEIDAHFYYLRYPLVHRWGAETLHERAGGEFPPDDPVPVTWSELAARGYPGANQHPAEEPAWLTVATTRPETYLGDSAVAVNPKDPRAKSLRHLSIELPLVGRIIPIVEDDYVVLPAAMQEDPEEAKKDPKAAYATGFLKVTPAHDQNDYELYHRHKSIVDGNSSRQGLINVMAPDATISDKHGWTDIGDAHIFVGQKREAARKLAVKEFEARGLLEGVKPYRHSVKHSDRSKAIVEPYLSDQWYVRVTDERMAPSANRALVPDQRYPGGHAGGQGEAATDGQLRFYPPRYAKTFEQWHDGIRDWCISRQLWWGHRIPVWTTRIAWLRSGQRGVEPMGGVTAEAVARSERLAVELKRLEATGRISQRTELTGGRLTPTRELLESQDADYFVCVKDPEDREATSLLEDNLFKQDPDVLDTWFSSALWPMSTLGWPDPTKYNAADNNGLLNAFNPSSVLCTAREIITLWVSRMVMFNRYFLSEATERRSNEATKGGEGRGPIPFRDVFIHAMIQDGEGRKMSKSLGNGVDPLDIIESHGADAMRFTLVAMTTNTQDVRMPVKKDSRTGKNTSEKFDNGRNYCNKLWNTARFVLEKLSRSDEATKRRSDGGGIQRAELSLLDRWMLSRLATTVKSVNASLAAYEFSDYADAMYKVLWWDLCDWYLEGVKPTVETNHVQRAVLAHALETIVRLLHPIAPFITEAIWEQVKELETSPIAGVTLDPSRKAGLLCTAGWPKIDESWIDAAAEREFEEVRELITAIRNVRSEHQVAPKRKITLHASAAARKLIDRVPGLVETLCGLDRIESASSTAPAGGGGGVAFRAGGDELLLSNLADAGSVDAGAEKDCLTKQFETLRKTETTISGRLSNPGYVDRAPAKLVEESKAQLAKTREEIAAIESKLKGLG